MNILCLGAVLCDIAAKTVNPDVIEKRRIELDSLNISGGGDANNASTDLAILGENVRVVSRVGNDFIGDMLIARLQANGVDTRYVVRDPSIMTTAAILMMGDTGVSTISARKSGACDKVCESDVTDEALEWADHLHVVNVMNMPDLDGAGLAKLFERAHAKGVTTSMDLKRPRKTLEHPMDCIRDALKNCDIFMPSDYEVEYLCGIKDIHEARDHFRALGVKIFVMKRGEEGAYITDYEEEVFQKTLFDGTPVDVTGAGDAFSSTFAASWRSGCSLKEAALYASAASARVISKVGTTAGMQSRAVLLEDIRKSGEII